MVVYSIDGLKYWFLWSSPEPCPSFPAKVKFCLMKGARVLKIGVPVPASRLTKAHYKLRVSLCKNKGLHRSFLISSPALKVVSYYRARCLTLPFPFWFPMVFPSCYHILWCLENNIYSFMRHSLCYHLHVLFPKKLQILWGKIVLNFFSLSFSLTD